MTSNVVIRILVHNFILARRIGIGPSYRHFYHAMPYWHDIAQLNCLIFSLSGHVFYDSVIHRTYVHRRHTITNVLHTITNNCSECDLLCHDKFWM